jgi:hypothetical protein
MRNALSTIQEVWQSLDDQEKERIKIRFSPVQFMITGAIWPLVARLPRSMVRGRDPSLPIDPNNSGEARVMRLRGYGNSIVPQLAAKFIRAFMDVATRERSYT